jgi:hypothetical protein
VLLNNAYSRFLSTVEKIMSKEQKGNKETKKPKKDPSEKKEKKDPNRYN